MSNSPQPPRPPPDNRARRRALDPARSFIVQAPAGSGKTELLVRRYLALLAKVEAPEQILAITFTRKATAEMRRRIVDALDAGQAPENSELRALAEAARANDARREWHLTGNTRRLRIHTIDAFCNELVWRMPWSARFGSPPNIVDDAAPLYDRAAKRALDHLERNDRWSDAGEALLALVDADWGKARSLLAAMLNHRDQWMRALAAGDWDAGDRERIERMWQAGIERELQAASEVFATMPPAWRDEWVELGDYAAGQLSAAGSDSPVLALRGAAQFPAASHAHIGQWHGLAELALTQKGEARKTVTKTTGFPVGDDDEREQKNRMLELLKALQDHPQIAAALNAVGRLPGGRFDDAQWHSIDALVKLLRLGAAELRLIFKERNQADYIELTQRAAMALGEADAPSDLALAFDYQLAHILMDEFQDTSSAHLELLEKLTAGWQRGDGRTLFLVGDPMQSIYRFREAEVGNFLQVAETRRMGGVALESIQLQANFRSTAQLVAWFNDTFAAALPARDDITAGAVSYAPAVAHAAQDDAKNAAAGAHVHAGIDGVFSCGDDGSAQPEAEAVVEIIAQARQQDPEQSIAVLGRTRRHLTGVAAALRRRAIAFRGRDLEKLGERPAIRDLIALTRALLQPADRVAMLSLLRAPWCGLTLADLSALVESSAATLPELWRDRARRAALSEDGRARLEVLAAAVADALHRRGRIDLRQNVEAAWLALAGPATMDDADLGDCARYFDLLSEMESAQSEITAANLHRAADQLWAQGGADAKVELLTVHKAKGLQFDTVIVPRLDRRPRVPTPPLLRWRKLPGQLLIAPLPSTSGGGDDPFYRYLKHLETRHERFETGRLLYVACTRARRNLHLFGNARSRDGEARAPGDGSLLALLWPRVQAHYQRAAADSTHAAADTAVALQPRPLHRLPRGWGPPPLPPGVATADAPAGGAPEPIEFSWAGEAARITGIVMHQIFRQIDAIGWEQWQRRAVDDAQKTRWRNQLIENGLPERDLQSALARIAAAIDNTRGDPRAEWIFSAAHRAIKSEWPLTGVVGGRIEQVVIDRSFVDENGARWVIDFKSSRHEGGNPDQFLDRERRRHDKQMALYAEVVGALHQQQVRLGLYFPALRGWREWAAEVV